MYNCVRNGFRASYYSHYFRPSVEIAVHARGISCSNSRLSQAAFLCLLRDIN